MLILLSSAKTMNLTPRAEVPFSTRPRFEQEAERIADQMSRYTASELQDILRTNRKIAEENRSRYRYFAAPGNPSLEAILAYTGIVFKRLNATDFTPDDFAYAQDHLRIASFGYGYLRPLDRIHGYRMEGDVVLPETDGLSMYEFWRERLTDPLIEDVKHAGGILCNLASSEMKRLFDWKRVEQEVRVITPDFSGAKDGKPIPVVHIKMARGETARYILKKRIERPEDLHLTD